MWMQPAISVSAGTLWGLFGLATEIRGWYWGRCVCWLSASQLPTEQGHSGALCGDKWRSRTGRDKVRGDRKGGDEEGWMTREQKRRRGWSGQRTERGVSRGDRHCADRETCCCSCCHAFIKIFKVCVHTLYECIYMCMRKIQVLLSFEHVHTP